MFKLQRILNLGRRNAVQLYRYSTPNIKPDVTEIPKQKTPTVSVLQPGLETDRKSKTSSKLDELLLKPEGIPTPPLAIEVEKNFAPFEEVPGPPILRHLANLLSFIPTFGNQVTTSTIEYMFRANRILGSQLTWQGNSYLFRWMLDEYGPIVRLRGPFGGDVVVLSRPEDAMAVFTAEGRYPVRSSLDCLENYRLNYRKMKNAGPFLMYGEKWETLRNHITKPLSKSTTYQFKVLESTTDELVNRIKKIRNKQEEVPPTFLEELHKWSLESLCSVMLGTKFGFLNQTALSSKAESARMLQGFYGATEAVRKCESGLHLWRYIETPAWRNLVKNCEDIDGILNKYILEAEHNLNSRKENGQFNASDKDIPLMEAMLLQEGISREDILTVLLDMILIGVNAIAHSAGFLLYHLARSPRAQRILADEIRGSNNPQLPKDIQQMTYLQACIKESLRLKPPIPFLSRITTNDIVINNYLIPKQTAIIMATYLSSLREENFDDATKFLPERWLDGSITNNLSFASMPFGHGPKECLAKNLAEMQLGLLLVKIINTYKVEYYYGEITSSNKLMASPNKPLKFRFVNRTR